MAGERDHSVSATGGGIRNSQAASLDFSTIGVYLADGVDAGINQCLHRVVNGDGLHLRFLFMVA
jgi:hypothetical protein